MSKALTRRVDAQVMCKEIVPWQDTEYAILHVEDKNGHYVKMTCWNPRVYKDMQEDKKYRLVFRNRHKNGRVYHNILAKSDPK